MSHIQAIDITLAVPSHDGNPDGFIAGFGIDDLLFEFADNHI